MHRRAGRRPLAAKICLGTLLVACGCANRGERYDRRLVAGGIGSRLGVAIEPVPDGTPHAIPPGVRLDDGVDATEAVAIALWNNAAFNEALSALGLARADLLQAGLLTNPTFAILFPIGPKQLEFAAKFPLEALWLLPARTEIAELRCGETAEILVGSGLRLASDVRKAHAAWVAACQKEKLAVELRAIAEELSRITSARLRAGDASASDEQLARAEAVKAEIESAIALKEKSTAAARLEGLVATPGVTFTTENSPFSWPAGPAGESAASLVQAALASRPDLRAAELELEAAGRHAGIARWEAFGISGILDANGQGKKGFEAGPGLELPIPLFHLNGGLAARASAELERAALHYATVRDAIALEVTLAHAEYFQAQASETAWRDRLLPSVANAMSLAEKAHARGEAPRADVLDGKRRWLRARVDFVALELSARQAEIELERAVGKRLDGAKVEVPRDAD